MTLPSFLTGKLWKLATAGAAVFALVLSALLMSSYVDNRNITKQREVLAKAINDPVNGYVVQLAQARTNVETLKVEVDRQNKAYTTLSKDSAARLAAAQVKLAAAQAETRVLERKIAGFLAVKPRGATLDERIRDVDQRAMKEFLP